MEHVTRENVDDLHAVLTVHLPHHDVEPKLQEELKKFRKQAQLKGFRKGHTPLSLVKRMYGKSILADVVQGEINKRLQEYLMEEKPNFFGQPILEEDESVMPFSLEEPADYTVKFSLGLVPDFTLQGLSESETLTIPEIDLDAKIQADQIDMLRRRHGDREEIETGPVEFMDNVELHLEEWADGKAVEGGVHTHTHFLINDRMSEELQKELVGKSVGDTFTFDPYTAEKDASEDYIRKYVLHLEENAPETSHEFSARIEKIIRVTPAEITQEFYDQAFGADQVHNEDEMAAAVRDQVLGQYKQQIAEYTIDQMRTNLLAANEIPLPEDFLQRWVKQTEADKPEEERQEWTDQQYRLFYLDLRWSLIRDQIVRDHELQIQPEEIVADYKEKLQAYFGGGMTDTTMLDQMAQQVLQEEETRNKIADQLIQQKVADVYQNAVTVEKDTVTTDDFRPWMEKAYEKINAFFTGE